MIKGDAVSIDAARFDGDEPGSFSSDTPDRLYGRIMGARKGGVYSVKWDGGGRAMNSLWSHLGLEIPKVSVETVLAILGDSA